MRALKHLVASLFSLPCLYLVLTLVFVLAPRWPAQPQLAYATLDNRLLDAAYGLAPAPNVPLSIALVSVPESTLTEFIKSPGNSSLTDQLHALYKQGAAFHLFLPQPVSASSTFSKSQLSELLNLAKAAAKNNSGDSSAQTESTQSLDEILRRLTQWQALRSDGKMLWLGPAGAVSESAVSTLDYAPAENSLLPQLQQWLALHVIDSNLVSGGESRGPVASSLLWGNGADGKKMLAPALMLVERTQQLTQLQWRDNQLSGQQSSGLTWSRAVPATGRIPVDRRLVPVELKLEDLAAQQSKFDLLLVAQQGDSYAATTAVVFNTLMANHYPKPMALSHWWTTLSLLLLALLFLPVYLRANGWILLLLSLFYSLLVAAVQLLAQLYYQWWLPVGVLLLFVWTLTILKWVLNFATMPVREMHQSWRRAWQQIVKQNLQAGKLAEAETALMEVTQQLPEEWQLPLTYELAQAYEKQRKYDQAEKLYRTIASQRRNFADVNSRIKRLHELSVGQVTGSMEATLVIDEQLINKPVLGRYEIQKELGRGAMGVVYLGRDPRISRMVAIKTLHYKHFDATQLTDVKARFFREAEAAGRLSHPNIVSVFDAGEEDDLAFIAMDYVPGKPLSYYAHPQRLLPVPIVYGLMAKAADALFYAHKHQIIHRDIKPSNLLYDSETGRLKVSDFGIARLVDNSRTRTGDVMGSPLYMSPEQLKGAKVSEAADIYSLGVTMYQLLCGQLPYDGDTLANLTYQIVQGKHPSVRNHRAELPSSATRITNKALQKDAEDRYQTAREMAEAIRKAIARDLTSS